MRLHLQLEEAVARFGRAPTGDAAALPIDLDQGIGGPAALSFGRNDRSTTMSYGQIAILSLIVGAFSTFGVVLAAVTWYCRPHAHRRGRHHRGAYPTASGLITDDD
jgi:hypothetical protein